LQTSRLVTVELPNGHLVVRVKDGPRLGTIFKSDDGWCYQFDGSLHEGPVCQNPEEALGAMEGVARL
jgi:hypothetical protein